MKNIDGEGWLYAGHVSAAIPTFDGLPGRIKKNAELRVNLNCDKKPRWWPVIRKESGIYPFRDFGEENDGG